MKNISYIMATIMAALLLILAGCGGEQDASVEEEESMEKAQSTEEDEGSAFEEVTSIETEGEISTMNFQLDEEGDTLFWGEGNGSSIGDDVKRSVWVDGEAQELDLDTFDQFSFLTDSGLIVRAETDSDAPANEAHSIVEYDPSTEESETFTAENEQGDHLLVSKGEYLVDPKMYIHTDTDPNDEFTDQTYLWNIENQEVSDITFLEDIKAEIGEITGNPHYFFNDDASKVYAIIMNGGIFSYEIGSGTTETLLQLDNMDAGLGYGDNLLADEEHIFYGVVNTESGILKRDYYALNLDTKETVKLGLGTAAYPVQDGNIAIVDEHEVKTYDFEKEALENFHTIELGDNQEINQVTVSKDASTIAYGVATEAEGDDEYSLVILNNGN
ncbi:hypothetical protein EQV77_13320 [Halobacillus fulvus]|nr:hypothetical protein EQV77_13320 [Halobacillus fulvus]